MTELPFTDGTIITMFRNKTGMDLPFWAGASLMVVLTFLTWPLPCRVSQAEPTGCILRDDAPNVIISSVPMIDFQGNVTGITIPLKRAGRLFFMEGTVNDIPGNFILDTGASNLVLNKTYFRNSIETEQEEGGGVTGAIGTIGKLQAKKIIISDLIYHNVPADVVPLGHLENRRGIKILGLFGMNLLQKTEIVLDLLHNQLQIFKLDRNGERLSKTVAHERYDIRHRISINRNILFVVANIAGKSLEFCLDTGAESNLLHNGIPKQAMGAVSITRRSTLRGAGASQGELLMGSISDFTLGSRQIGPMETAVCNLSAMAEKYGYDIDGMLGYDFFMKGKVSLNLVKKEMAIAIYPEGKP